MFTTNARWTMALGQLPTNGTALMANIFTLVSLPTRSPFLPNRGERFCILEAANDDEASGVLLTRLGLHIQRAIRLDRMRHRAPGSLPSTRLDASSRLVARVRALLFVWALAMCWRSRSCP